MSLRLRKWWHAGAEVTIRLTRIIGDDEGKLLHRAIHAFSAELAVEAASPLGGPTLARDELKSVPVGGDGEGSENATLRRALPGAHTEAEPAVPCPHCGSVLHGVT